MTHEQAIGELAAVLERSGHTARAIRLRSALAAIDGPSRIVIVGETKRGKSSLLNALVARPNTSPVGIELTTASAVVVRHGETFAARVRLADGTERPVPIDGIAEWVSAGVESAGAQRVEAVEIDLPHPILGAGVVLVDTPGLGGLIPAHGRIALETARGADGCVLVLDAMQPMLDTDVQLLRRLRADGVPVIVAVTKIDRQPDWQAVVAESRAALARVAPDLADTEFLPVSSHLREQALTTEDATRRADLDKASGVPALWLALRKTVVAEVRERRVQRLANDGLSGLAVVESETTSRRDAARATAYDDADRLERERLDRLQFESGDWDRTLRRGLAATYAGVGEATERGFRELRDELTAAIDAQDPKEVAAWLEDAVETGVRSVAGTAFSTLIEGAARVAAELAARCDAPAARLGATGGDPDVGDWQGFSADSAIGAPDVVVLVPTLLSAAGLAHYAAPGLAAAVGSVAVVPFVIAVAAPFAVLLGGAHLYRQRRMATRVKRNELRTWIRETLAAARADLTAALGRAHASISAEAEQWLRDRVWERRAEVTRALATLNEDRQRSAAERAEIVRECDRLLVSVAQLRTRLAAARPVATAS